MKRRYFLAFALAGLAPAIAAMAQTPLERLTAMLAEQGFTVVRSERTLLGRILVIAQNAQYTREIVIDRASGEVLRDIWTERGTGKSALPATGSNAV